MIDEAELAEVLSSFRDGIDLVLAKVDAMDQMYHAQDERVHQLEKVLYDDIVNPALDAFDKAETEDRFNQFHERHGEKLDSYNDSLRSIEGDDFDLTRQAFNDYEAVDGERPDEDEYVDALVEQVEAQLQKIRESVGASEVKVETNEEGETTVTADGEVLTDDTAETPAEETPAEETPAEDEVADEETPANDDDMEALMAELREAKKHF